MPHSGLKLTRNLSNTVRHAGSVEFSPKFLNPLAWYDIDLATPGQTVIDQMGGTAATLGSTAGADSNDPLWLPWYGEDFVQGVGSSPNYVWMNADATFESQAYEIVFKGARPAITGAFQPVFYLRTNGGPNGLLLRWDSAGAFMQLLLGDGTSFFGYTAGVDCPCAVGQVLWHKIEFVANNGTNSTCKFYTSSDGITWTQYGTTNTQASFTAAFIADQLYVASNSYQGDIRRFQLKKAIGGPVFANLNASSFAAGSAITYVDTGGTWTMQRATSGRKETLVKGRGLLLLGTDDFWTVPTASVPSFGTATPGTIVVVGRTWPTPATSGRWIDTRGSATETVAGVSIRQDTINNNLVGTIGDGTNTVATAPVAYTSGQLVVASLLVNTGTISLRVNGTTSATVARPPGSATGTTPIIGAATTAAANMFEGEMFAVLTAARLLTPSELAMIETYYGAGT